MLQEKYNLSLLFLQTSFLQCVPCLAPRVADNMQNYVHNRAGMEIRQHLWRE